MLLRLGLRFWSGVRLRVGVGIRWGGSRSWSRGWSRSRRWGWGRRGGDIAPLLMPLHVPHASDGLDLGFSGSPVVPVLEVSMLKHVLVPPVAWIRVSHPTLMGKDIKSNLWDTNNSLLKYLG